MSELNNKYNEYTSASDQLIELINNIITAGEVTQEDKNNINTMTNTKDASLLELQKEISQTELDYTNNKLDYLQNQLGEINSQLIKEKDRIQMTVADTTNNSEKISQVEQTANQIYWLVKSGDSQSTMVLTDEFYKLMSDYVLIDAKKIELNGSININNGLFVVSTTGNTKIGGNTSYTIDGYQRAQCEITSSGTIYSVSSTVADSYTRIKEGKILLRDGDPDIQTEISGSEVKTVSVVTGDVSSGGGDLYLSNSNNCEVQLRTSGGNAYVNPADNGATRLGSTSYYWNIVYATGGVNTGSDRTIKENIQYLNYDNINTLAETDNQITTSDCLEFINNDYLLATYNYISDKDKKTKLSAIAQDILVNEDGTDNKIGQMIVDTQDAVNEQGTLSMNQTQLINVLVGAVQQLSKEVEELKQRLGED